MKTWDSWINGSTAKYGGVIPKQDAELQNAYTQLRSDPQGKYMGERDKVLILDDERKKQLSSAIAFNKAKGIQ